MGVDEVPPDIVEARMEREGMNGMGHVKIRNISNGVNLTMFITRADGC